jgi:hypothetical protein
MVGIKKRKKKKEGAPVTKTNFARQFVSLHAGPLGQVQVFAKVHKGKMEKQIKKTHTYKYY